MTLHLPISAQKKFIGVQSIALIGNGAVHDYAFIANLIKDYEQCVAIDGGLFHCNHMRIRPILILGDFDSIPQPLLDHYSDVPMEKFLREKNESDMELAIRAVNTASMKKIGVFGALEKRMDHSLGNLYLASRMSSKVVIESERETVFSIEGHQVVNCFPGQTLSLIPLGSPALGVTTQGLKWELQEATLDAAFMSLSNICQSTSFEISIKQGNLICCLSRE